MAYRPKLLPRRIERQTSRSINWLGLLPRGDKLSDAGVESVPRSRNTGCFGLGGRGERRRSGSPTARSGAFSLWSRLQRDWRAAKEQNGRMIMDNNRTGEQASKTEERREERASRL